jgi:hypothetical protein
VLRQGVETEPANQRINATVRPVRPLAVASVVPIRPARYAQRYVDKES